MNAETNNEIWQVETGGDIVETSFDEMAAWIADGSLLKIDRVRKGDLRWIEAGKVPALLEFFNAHDSKAPPAKVFTMTHKERLGVVEQSTSFVNHHVKPADACSMHPDAPARYVCDTCTNLFCKACPSSYGASVKICPFCGAMCEELVQTQTASTSHHPYRIPITEKFGFGDFARAIAYPFRFKFSLVVGALMFAFFSAGEGVAKFGDIFLMFGALACFLLANTLTFGILANTVDNFSQGKLNENFMPSFEDFSLWESVIHPFFLSIGVYVASFGPLIVVLLAAFFLMAGPVQPETSDAGSTVNQTQQLKDLLGKQADAQKKRIEELSEPPAIAGGQTAANNAAPTAAPVLDQSDIDADKAQKLIEQVQKSQLESDIGKAPETAAAERSAMIQQLLAKGPLLLLLLGATLLWGLFYFPAASAVAGYTRSLGATLNPMVGLDTIRHLGLDYAKILVMALILAAASGVVGSILSTALAPFDMPLLGNVPANVISSLFGFYLSVVFSCTLAYALYKASDRLKLAR